MIAREYKPEDEQALRRMHELQGFGYPFPKLDSKAFVTKQVLEADGRVVMAILLRLTSEAYFLHDPLAGTPRERWQQFLELHDAANDNAFFSGFDDAHAFLPPAIAKGFGRRLEKLGWKKEPWAPYWRPTQNPARRVN